MRNILIWIFAISISAIACELENPEVGVNVDEIITFSIEEGVTSLQANGQDRMTLTANLGRLTDANQLIVFTTELGRFAEASPSNPQVYQVVASGKQATATLITGTEAADEVNLTATVGDFVASSTIPFLREFPQDMTIVADKENIDADRIDFANIDVELFRNAGEGIPSDAARIDIEAIPQDTALASVVPFVFSSGTSASFTIKSQNGKPGLVLLRLTTEAEGENAPIERTLELLFE
ncbi:MAG: hypothetical protein AAGH79_08430 [Bacteroidota bacterium]